MSFPCTCTDAGPPVLRTLHWALLLCLSLASWSVGAAPLEKLLMPGKLTQAHAKYEDDCKQCHTSFKQGSQNRQCLDCHDKVDADIREHRGFHGLAPQVSGAECRQCHSEHKGRKADIIGLVPALFDHAHTDFALEGAHSRVACADCHKAGKPMREAPGTCIDCHRKDDVHKGEMGKQCADCHGPRSWRKSEFDHEKTDFPLTHRHRDVSCASCHPDRRYRKTPTTCVACHSLQDRHGGLFGKNCADCHDSRGWKEARFDHDKTEFPLSGRHRRADCHACHTEQTRDRKLPTDCYACHRGSDIHQGRFGRDCASCHSTDGWKKKSFDHDRDTAFALRGAHQNLGCASCHSGQIATTGRRHPDTPSDGPTRSCVDCHRLDDVHHGQQGDRCDRCHQEKSWRQSICFDHDLTRFPLVGLHATASCAECHLDEAYPSTPQTCSACHKNDDEHEGTLGSDCAACHNPAGWKRWTFDHDRQTDFPLKGKHQQAACKACHHDKVAKLSDIDPGSSCYSCHASDDAHHGSFGKNCERCHQPSAFSDVEIRSRFGGGRREEAR